MCFNFSNSDLGLDLRHDPGELFSTVQFQILCHLEEDIWVRVSQSHYVPSHIPKT